VAMVGLVLKLTTNINKQSPQALIAQEKRLSNSLTLITMIIRFILTLEKLMVSDYVVRYS
jgi:hypothetical protein